MTYRDDTVSQPAVARNGAAYIASGFAALFDEMAQVHGIVPTPALAGGDSHPAGLAESQSATAPEPDDPLPAFLRLVGRRPVLLLVGGLDHTVAHVAAGRLAARFGSSAKLLPFWRAFPDLATWRARWPAGARQFGGAILLTPAGEPAVTHSAAETVAALVERHRPMLWGAVEDATLRPVEAGVAWCSHFGLVIAEPEVGEWFGFGCRHRFCRDGTPAPPAACFARLVEATSAPRFEPLFDRELLRALAALPPRRRAEQGRG